MHCCCQDACLLLLLLLDCYLLPLPTLLFFVLSLNRFWYFVIYCAGKLLIVVVSSINRLIGFENVYSTCVLGVWYQSDENYHILFGKFSDLLLCYFFVIHGIPSTLVNIGNLIFYDRVACTSSKQAKFNFKARFVNYFNTTMPMPMHRCTPRNPDAPLLKQVGCYGLLGD